MGKILFFVSLPLAQLACFYYLYLRGCLTLRIMSCLLFVRPFFGQQHKSEGTFRTCNAYLKRVIKFKTEGEYNFQLTANLTKGNILAEVRTKNEGELLSLDPVNNSGVIQISPAERYYLVIRIKKASGNYKLTWSRSSG